MLRNFFLVVSILCLLITAAVAQVRLAFSHEMATGTQESIPIVYRGRIYIVHPGSVIQDSGHRRHERQHKNEGSRDL